VNGLHRLLAGTAVGSTAILACALGGALAVRAATGTSYQVLVADGTTGTVLVIDAGATTATTLGAPVPGGIQSLAISPDGSRVYVAFKDGMLGTIDTASDSYVGAPIDLGSTSAPGEMAVTPDGKDIYVAETGLSQVVEVDTSTSTVIGSPIATGPAVNLAITPDGASLFVDGGSRSASVSVIATASNTVTGTAIPVATPGVLAVSPDGSHVYVVTSSDSGPGLAVIDNATETVESSFALSATSQPAGLAVSPDGSELYVTDGTGQELATVDIATSTLSFSLITLPVGFASRDVAITADGPTAYVDGTTPSGSGEVVTVDLASGTVSAPISLTGGTQPAGLVIAPWAPATTPTPSPTPTPDCSPGPIMIDPGPMTVPPAPPAAPNAGAGVSSTGVATTVAPAATPPSTSTAVPPPTTLPPDPTTSPSPGTSSGFGSGPIPCFGPLTAGGIPGVESLARSDVAPPAAGLYAGITFAVLAFVLGVAAMEATRRGWVLRLPRLRAGRSG